MEGAGVTSETSETAWKLCYTSYCEYIFIINMKQTFKNIALEKYDILILIFKSNSNSPFEMMRCDKSVDNLNTVKFTIKMPI